MHTWRPSAHFVLVGHYCIVSQPLLLIPLLEIVLWPRKSSSFLWQGISEFPCVFILCPGAREQ